MSRYHRQDPIDGWHHITNHAVGRENLFLVDRDRRQFIRRLYEAAKKYTIAVVSFCLMGNHFHLVVHCPAGGLSKFMHYLESIYAREFNTRHGRRGALFRAEFGNTLIMSEGQLLATIRYVHRNPLELAIDISTYPWSSYRSYVADDHGIFRPDPLISMHLLGGAHQHRKFVEEDFPSDDTRIAAGVRQLLSQTPDHVEEALADLVQIASKMLNISSAEIVAPRSRVRNDARLAVTLVAYESRTGFAEEMRTFLGYATAPTLRTAVHRARARHDTDREFAQMVRRIRLAWGDVTQRRAS